MSLWWAKREQLDPAQVSLIEDLPLNESFVVIGPPGSGKSNVLLRRAQFVRAQDFSNVMVLTYTRALTEFLKTGCFDAGGREIFPPNLISTIEGWIRDLYGIHGRELPNRNVALPEWKRALASGALEFASQDRIPKFDGLFIDEAQDLIPEEVELLSRWSDVLFFVGDDRQRIYSGASGLEAISQLTPKPELKALPFHYRLAPELCVVADRITEASAVM